MPHPPSECRGQAGPMNAEEDTLREKTHCQVEIYTKKGLGSWICEEPRCHTLALHQPFSSWVNGLDG